MTLKEIAEKLNLSYSTVSAVMRDRSEELHISPATAERVRKAAKEFGYKPNLAARALRNNRSYNIGVLLPSPRDLSYAVMVADIQHRLANTEYTGIFSFWESEDKIRNATENILKYNIEGLITNEPAYLPKNLKIPVVTYFQEHPAYDFVCYSQQEVAEISLEYLYRLGHRNIGIVYWKNGERVHHLRQIIREQGMREAGIWQIGGTGERCDGLEQALAAGQVPDAIVANNDESAMLIIQYAEKYGIAVPRDMSVIGCNDNWIAQLASPPLTTIRRTDEAFGALLAEILLKRLANPELPRIKYITRQTLIERGSCAECKKKEKVL
jgi:LacI family transcriptional regulator